MSVPGAKAIDRTHVPPNVQPAEAMSRATAAVDAGDYATALLWLSATDQGNPVGADAWALSSRAHLALGHNDVALAHAQRASAQHPSEAAFHVDVGDALLAGGNRAGAEHAYRSALQRTASRPIHRELAVAYTRLEMYSEAADFLARARSEPRRPGSRVRDTELAGCALELAVRTPARRDRSGHYVITDPNEITRMRALLDSARAISASGGIADRAGEIEHAITLAIRTGWAGRLEGPPAAGLVLAAVAMLTGAGLLVGGSALGVVVIGGGLVVGVAALAKLRVPQWKTRRTELDRPVTHALARR